MLEILITVLSIAGGILTLLGFIPFRKGALKGEFPLLRAALLVWMIEGWILFFLYSDKLSRWVLLALALGFSHMFYLSIRYGKPGWSRVDKWVLACAGFTILIWMMLDRDSGRLAGIATDATGGISFLMDASQNPAQTRTKFFRSWWLLWFLGAIANFCSISCWFNDPLGCLTNPESWFPIYGIALTSTMVFIILFNKSKPKQQLSKRAIQYSVWCPQCSEANEFGSLQCNFCGFRFECPFSPISLKHEMRETGWRYPFEEVPSKYCIHCGAEE